MLSWSCSLSCCDLSHVELMGSCHNFTTLLDMKAGHCTPPLAHTPSHNPFIFSKRWQDGSRLCLISSGHCGNQKHVVSPSDQLIAAKQFFFANSHDFPPEYSCTWQPLHREISDLYLQHNIRSLFAASLETDKQRIKVKYFCGHCQPDLL